MQQPRIHGGPGPEGPARFDFSTTSNALGPHQPSLLALKQADHTCYPDPSYRQLRENIAQLHGVSTGQILFAASASEFIFRCTAVSGTAPVCVPTYGFGDYTTAAIAYKRKVVTEPDIGSLCWYADPGSPRGTASPPPEELPEAEGTLCVLDRACAPLRLEGCDAWPAAHLKRIFQLYSPNKALGLTGMRAAYAVAPEASPWTARLEAACPSWPLGAASVALLNTWSSELTQHWVATCRVTLKQLKLQQDAGLASLGFTVEPSVGNFALVRPPESMSVDRVNEALLQASIAWRETTSFGLPGAWRVSVQNNEAQRAMFAALQSMIQL